MAVIHQPQTGEGLAYFEGFIYSKHSSTSKDNQPLYWRWRKKENM